MDPNPRYDQFDCTRGRGCVSPAGLLLAENVLQRMCYVHLVLPVSALPCHRNEEILGDLLRPGDVDPSFAPDLKDDESLWSSDSRAFSRNSLHCTSCKFQS